MTSVSTIKSHRLDVPQQNDSNQEEVVDEQQLVNQERNFIVVQVGADCSQIKEEQEDVCISQEGEQFGLKQETQTFDEDFPQQPECKEEEVLTEQQLWNQERNSVQDQEEAEPPQVKDEEEEAEPPQVKDEEEEAEPPQVKDEEEELLISQEGEQLVMKLEADTFMVTHISEETQQSDAEPNSEQLLCHNSAGTEIQDDEGSQLVDSGSAKEEEPKPKKRRLETGSHSNSDDNSRTSTTLCENETDAPQLHDCKEEKVLTVQRLCNQERNSSLDQEEQDAAQLVDDARKTAIIDRKLSKLNIDIAALQETRQA
ncbi:uncharacterized protein KZ484_017829 [Pholidichthys leucotaenia]